MSALQITGLVIMAAGTIMAVFFRVIIQNSMDTVGSDEDGIEILSKSAMFLKIIGLVVVIIGCIVFFI